MKKGYVGIHSSGFKDFLLKPELLRAIQDCGFEHPSEGERWMRRLGGCLGAALEAWSVCCGVGSCRRGETTAGELTGVPPAACPRPAAVQHECIPQAILGMDVICQAKSGMGKTAVFVISVLQQLEPVDGQVAALVLCHTRELAFQASGGAGAGWRRWGRAGRRERGAGKVC